MASFPMLHGQRVPQVFKNGEWEDSSAWSGRVAELKGLQDTGFSFPSSPGSEQTLNLTSLLVNHAHTVWVHWGGPTALPVHVYKRSRLTLPRDSQEAQSSNR